MTTRLLTAIGCAVLLAACGDGAPRIDAQDAKNVAAGKAIYARHCAACHGANLEGQPNWRRRLPNGRLPAPPHDASGHSWHHPDTLLFGIVKNGLVPPYAPAGYASDMPAFGGVLSDDQIRAVLAYIQSRWPKQVMEARAEMLRGQAR
jgi:mono/diheme cytochrome c family protein